MSASPSPAPADERSFALRLPATPGSVRVAREAVERLGQRSGLGHGVLVDARLALSEACTNAVTHAYRPAPDRRATVEVEAAALHDGRLTLVVRDFGVGVRPRVDTTGAGLGLTLIASLVQTVRITR